MPRDEVGHLLKRIQEIQPLPAAVQRLCALLNDSDSDMKDVSRVISTDPALTAKLLKLANSAFYGLPRRVSTIPQAVVVLGFSGVRNLALGVSLFGFRSSPQRKLSLNMEAFWRHSLAVATSARLLAPHLRMRDLEEAFVSGLLHDIGKIVLMEHFQESYSKILEASSGGMRLHAAETEAFGIDHAEVGRQLCEHWKIPAALTRGIAEHYPCGKAGSWLGRDPLVSAVWLSDNLSKLYPFGFDGDPNVDPDFLGILGAGGELPEQLRRALLALPSELEKAKIFFDLREMPLDRERHSGDCCRIGVRVRDPRLRELVSLTLLGLGHALPAAGHEESLTAVVSDGSVSLPSGEAAGGGQPAVLDFRQWMSCQNHSDGSVNTLELRKWLQETLPSHPAKEPAP